MITNTVFKDVICKFQNLKYLSTAVQTCKQVSIDQIATAGSSSIFDSSAVSLGDVWMCRYGLWEKDGAIKQRRRRPRMPRRRDGHVKLNYYYE